MWMGGSLNPSLSSLCVLSDHSKCMACSFCEDDLGILGVHSLRLGQLSNLERA